MNLCQLLSIPPLSKVQLSSRRAIEDAQCLARYQGRIASPADLPFWFFQCEHGGLLELRSPGGFMTRVSPHDICDVEMADPVIVLAMPRETFMKRLNLPHRERMDTYGPDLFSPAHVLWVSKDRWGRVDQAHVRFIDSAYNDSPGPLACSVSDESLVALNSLARRTRMPVIKYGDHPNSSAMSGDRKEDRSARRRIASLLTASLAGRRTAAFPCDA